jgi:integrase/recombinase XerD
MELLQSATADFLRHCRFEKNLSPKTLKAYSIDLHQLQRFLLSHDYPLLINDITKTQLRDFLEFIAGLKPRSIKRKIATVKALFNYLEFEDRVPVNPFRKMQIRIKENNAIPSVMDMREITKIFNAANRHRNGVKDRYSYQYLASLRDIVIIELLFATGARVSEIAGIRFENVNLATGSITIKGKGNKERLIHICNPETIAALKSYRSICTDRAIDTGGYFLANRFSQKISDQSIRGIVKRLSSRAGITRRITPHVFRHSFATLLLERDVDIKYIQSLLGHSSITTTQIYTHVNRARQKQILSKKHPRKDFSLIHEIE